MKLMKLIQEARLANLNKLDSKELNFIKSELKRMEPRAPGEFDNMSANSSFVSFSYIDSYPGRIDMEDTFVHISKELEKKTQGQRFRYTATFTEEDHVMDEVLSTFIDPMDKMKELKSFMNGVRNVIT